MKVTVLGGNGPFPAAGGACSSYLVEQSQTRILVDAGSGSMSNLMKLTEPDKVDAIFLSHLHWDHMTDIPVLFYYLHVMALNGKISRNIPLYMPSTPKGMFETINGFNRFDTVVLDSDSMVEAGDIKITARRMTHPVESYALKFNSNGKVIVYSGDTTYNNDLVSFASGCDLLITDSGFLDKQLKPSSPHMSAAQCAGIAADAGVGRLMLSHLNPYTRPDEYLDEARKIFDNTFTAKVMNATEV